MAFDDLFSWMTSPPGLAVIALAIALPFLVWRVVLGRAFQFVGFTPLVAGYLLAAIGLLVLHLGTAYFQFNADVAKGILPEARRWSTVSEGTIYSIVLSLAGVLPLVGLVGVPLSALLLKLRRLSLITISMSVVATWLTLVLFAWSFPINEWHRISRLESLTVLLAEMAPSAALVTLPFLLGMYLASRSYRNSEI